MMKKVDFTLEGSRLLHSVWYVDGPVDEGWLGSVRSVEHSMLSNSGASLAPPLESSGPSRIQTPHQQTINLEEQSR